MSKSSDRDSHKGRMTNDNDENIAEQTGPEAAHESEAASPPAEVMDAAAVEPPSGTPDDAQHGVPHLTARDAFAEDEESYKAVEESPQAKSAGNGINRPPMVPILPKRFSFLQKSLVGGIVLIAVVMLCGLLKSRPRQADGRTISFGREPPQAPQIPSSQQVSSPQATGSQEVARPMQEGEPMLPAEEPLSLNVAETYFTQEQYEYAYAAYDQLLKNLGEESREGLLREFLRLRMGLCITQDAKRKGERSPAPRAGEVGQGKRLLIEVSLGRSPAIRVVADYHLSLLALEQKNYLEARTRAFQATALLGAVDCESEWTSAMRRDCHFLAAQSFTQQVLSLCDADKDLPPALWKISSSSNDPFEGRDEDQLRSLLTSGCKKLRKAMLGPRVTKLGQAAASASPLGSTWSVVCWGAPIEELLARFAANASLDIRWPVENSAKATEVALLHKKPVFLCMPATTAQQFVAVAAGSTGLVGRVDDKGIIRIYDPAEYAALSEHIAVLSADAVSLWQRFLLSFADDPQAAHAHLALAMLHNQSDRLHEAISEYKIVANQFWRSKLGSLALLYSSKLKSRLHDYSGARDDLKELVELYPDSPFADQACLYLADATMKAGQTSEAGKLYQKVYGLGLSSEPKAASALGAARCCFEQGDYKGAIEWASRYVSLAPDEPGSDLYSGYRLLGKSCLALGKSKAAGEALERALAMEPTENAYVDTVTDLVKAYTQQSDYARALQVVEDVRSWQLSPQQQTDMLLLKARLLREMGLVDKAVAAIGDRAEYAMDQQSKAKTYFEQAKCAVAKGQLDSAHETLSRTLSIVEPGPLAEEISVELADVCVKLGHNAEAVSVCLQVLDWEPARQTRQRALELLATAYAGQKNYESAVLALCDQLRGHYGQEHKAPAARGQAER